VEEIGSVLSVGSGDRDFRSRFQPWIDGEVFDRLDEREIPVLHHEMVAAEGVDVVGDLRDESVRAGLSRRGVRTILCLNVLEHVPEPDMVVLAIEAALPPGGRAILTVPRRYPYHADPIDTMFRPSPEELAQLFTAGMTVEVGAVRCESLAAHWLAKPGKVAALRKALRPRSRSSADLKPPRSSRAVELASMAFISTEITYAIAQRR
jgi:hypothetical protein